MDAIDELMSEDLNEQWSPEKLSALEAINEQTHLKDLLSEDYFIPLNAGALPNAEYNQTVDSAGRKPLANWVYPSAK